LELARENNVTSLAFPSISTGIYGYPIELAVPVAVTAVRQCLGGDAKIREVVFCCFAPSDLAVNQRSLD
jgi:O-acetyl-ADP-ribose deacetylase (regulator of RNase III)